MSTVSNYILSVGLGEEGDDGQWPAVAELNRLLLGEYGGSVGDGFVLARYEPVKGKALEADVFLLAANCVCQKQIAMTMRLVSWRDPEDAQLFAKHQEETRFYEVNWQSEPPPWDAQC